MPSARSNLHKKRKDRKRQTQLTFDPVEPTGSPSLAGSLNLAPAKVRYATRGATHTPGSNTPIMFLDNDSDDPLSANKGKDKGYKISSPSSKNIRGDGRIPFKPLPTPTKSSQVKEEKNDTPNALQDPNSDSDIQSSRPSRQANSTINNSKHSSKERQGGSFDGAADSSEGTPRKSFFTTAKSSQSSPPMLTLSTLLPLPSTRQDNFVTAEEDISPFERRRAPHRGPGMFSSSTASGTRTKAVRYEDDSEDSEASQIASKKGPTSTENPVSSDSDEEGPIKSNSTGRRANGLRNRSSVAIHIDDDDDDDEEDAVSFSPVRKRRPAVMLDDDSEDISPTKRKRSPPKDSENEEDIISPTKRRKSIRQEDSDSDLPPLSNIPTRKKKITSSQELETPGRYTRQQKTKRHRTEKEKSMEILRRKRLGEKNPQLTSSESESEASGDDNMVELSEFDDEEESDLEVQKPRQRAQTGNDEDDFIIDDEEGSLGVPDYNIPLEFTRHANKPEKEHFKDMVEWMVQNKLNPAFNKDDPLYKRAFQKLDQKPATLRASKYGSSQWTSDFIHALESRPELIIRDLASGEGFSMRGEIRCEACNRSKHQPTFAIEFHGKPYHKDSLEEVEQDDDEEDSDDGSRDDTSHTESTVRNEMGIVLPPSNKEWLSGRFCKDKAQKAHLLHHWKFELNQWVIGNLESEGELRPEKLVARDKMTTEKRRQYANRIVDRWEESKILKDLYRDYKNQVSELEEAKLDEGGWGRKKR